ncbi:transcriptional regulatory protein KdpE [Arthrobacter sp. Hiyo1]|nr:transcriptional regulatory protein KdpE [Arthrobacter sp. Hiyo1]
MSHVLVVDDDPHIVKALRITLQAHGYTVATASDGESALRSAAQHPVGVLILDLGLPDIDGTTVITRLREWSSVPILVLSARHGSDDKVEALDAGADDYITKPFGLDELLARSGRSCGAPLTRAKKRPCWSLNRSLRTLP